MSGRPKGEVSGRKGGGRKRRGGDIRGRRVRFGSLEGHAEGSVPDELGDDSLLGRSQDRTEEKEAVSGRSKRRETRTGTNEGPRNTEEDCVKVLVGETVVSEAVAEREWRRSTGEPRKKLRRQRVKNEQNTRVSVHVGPGVLGLSGGEEDVRDELIELSDELEELVVGEVLESELSLGLVSGIL